MPRQLVRAAWWHRAALGRLALESKAVWGYDSGFLRACAGDLQVPWLTMLRGDVFICRDSNHWQGFYAITYGREDAELTHLFVHPRHLGSGVGKCLWVHAVAQVQRRIPAGGDGMLIIVHSDPHARAFYEHMGAVQVGEAESAVKPGRKLPLLHYTVEGSGRTVYHEQTMTQELAGSIAQWCYPEPYDMYSFGTDPEAATELMNGTYWAILDDQGRLRGYYCVGTGAQVPGGEEFYNQNRQQEVVDVGLGMNPVYVGAGEGRNFVGAVLALAGRQRPEAIFRLTVAAFNQRAIRVYEALGFREIGQFSGKRRPDLVFMVMVHYQGGCCAEPWP